MRCILFVALAVLAAHAPAGAQARAEAPPRPALPAEADSNDARQYLALGQELLERRPANAADAFYWAWQIDPGSADALYGRFAALLMKDLRRLVRYYEGSARSRERAELEAIDSLSARALRMDPFLRPQFDRPIIRRYLVALMTGRGGATPAEAEFDAAWVLDELPPLMRGRLLAGEGRLMEALAAFDEALSLGREGPAGLQRFIRHERARLFAQAGNDSMALVELGRAVEAGEDAEREDGLPFYESKAVLAHSQGIVHERRRDLVAAREAYARALVEDLSYHAAHARLGALALAEGDSATALAELAMAAEAAPGEPATRLAHATMLARMGRFVEAEAEALAATELTPYYADAWLLLGLMRDARGGNALDAYRAFVDRARRDDPRRARAEQLLAQRAAAEPAPPAGAP